MNNNYYNDFRNICRTCLSNYDLKSIQHDNKIIEILHKFDVRFEINDELPQQLCRNCFDKIHDIHAFAAHCKQTHSSLVECLNNYKKIQINQEKNVIKETNEVIKIKEELIVDEHKIEFVEVQDSTNEDLIIKQETVELNDDMILETSDYNNDQNINCSADDLLKSHTKNTSDSESLPSDIEDATTQLILPPKSRRKYESAYERFIKWCNGKNIKNFTNEKVLLTYFENMSKKYKSSSLWAYYSMVRATMSLKKNVDISKYTHLVAFLKKQSKDYKPKKSRIFSKEEVATFLKEADDLKFLLCKVALIIGLVGSCRKEELTNLLLENVKDEGHFFHVQIPNTRTKVSREFFVTSGTIEGINMVEIVRRYVARRPRHIEHGRFFIGYRNGSCVKQPVGINSFGAMPKNIATYLKLPNPEEYTGHCFRRSATSLLAYSGPAPPPLNVIRN